MTHTPGPWEVYREDGLPVSVRTLAPDCYGSRILKYFAFLRKNAEANARLIAAAPELYAVVEEWLTIGNNLKARKAIREKARAALTKARGEA